MAKTETSVEPTLPQLQWLLERMNASRDPITRQQVETFGRHPGGPILPPECIAVERLPDTFGTRSKDRLRLADDGPVHDLAMSPANELWIATVIDGLSTLVSHGTPEGDHPYAYAQKRKHPFRGLTHIELLADEEMGTMFSPRIIGFRPDGAPITLLKKVASCSDSEYWDDDALIFIGGERAFVGRFSKQRLTAIRVTRDGAVLTAHQVSRDRWVIYRNGEEVLGTGTTVGDLWEIGDRIVWTGQFGKLFARGVDGLELPNGESIVHDRDIRDVFMREGALHYITTGYDGHGANLHSIDDGKVCSIWSSDGHVYFRGFEEFPDGHVAYIGETVRDQRECWVVDDVAAPGFEHVSGFVFRASRARYYGVLGRHLYTMELPGVTPA